MADEEKNKKDEAGIVDSLQHDDEANDIQKPNARTHVGLGVIVIAAFAAAVACGFAFMDKVIVFGQSALYGLTGGALHGVVTTPTTLSVIVMTIDMVLCSLAIKAIADAVHALIAIGMGKSETVGTFLQGIAYVVIACILACLMPSLCTSAWLGAIIICVAIVHCGLLHPSLWDKTSFVSSVRQAAVVAADAKVETASNESSETTTKSDDQTQAETPVCQASDGRVTHDAAEDAER